VAVGGQDEGLVEAIELGFGLEEVQGGRGAEGVPADWPGR
jgi:hypothetical protein